MKKIFSKIATGIIGRSIAKVTALGIIKPLPGTGIGNEVGSAIADIKLQNNYKRLITRLLPYLVGVSFAWYLIYKGWQATEILGLLEPLLRLLSNLL